MAWSITLKNKHKYVADISNCEMLEDALKDVMSRLYNDGKITRDEIGSFELCHKKQFSLDKPNIYNEYLACKEDSIYTGEGCCQSCNEQAKRIENREEYYPEELINRSGEGCMFTANQEARRKRYIEEGILNPVNENREDKKEIKQIKSFKNKIKKF